MPMYKYKKANIELPYPPAAYRFYKTALVEYSLPKYLMYKHTYVVTTYPKVME